MTAWPLKGNLQKAVIFPVPNPSRCIFRHFVLSQVHLVAMPVIPRVNGMGEMKGNEEMRMGGTEESSQNIQGYPIFPSRHPSGMISFLEPWSKAMTGCQMRSRDSALEAGNDSFQGAHFRLLQDILMQGDSNLLGHGRHKYCRRGRTTTPEKKTYLLYQG